MSSAWAKLRRALLPSHAAAHASSVANPGVFPLFAVSHHPDDSDALAECAAASSGDGCYFKETVTHREASVTLRLRREGTMTLDELKHAQTRKVDNTGAVCQWPCETILAWHCVKNAAAFAGARVLELGAGMSGLAGLMLASHCTSPVSPAAPPPSCIVLTDGNPISARHLEHNVRLNRTDASAPASADSVEAARADADVAPLAYPPPTADCDLRHVGRCGATAMGAGTLVWNREADYSALGKFDFILVADCLFFVDFHDDLVHVLRSMLATNGQAWICGPTRSHSLARFVDCARAGGLCVDRRDRFDERVWSMHCAFAAAETASPLPESDPTSAGSEQVDCNAPPKQQPQYVPDRHQPILLIVTLPRPER